MSTRNTSKNIKVASLENKQDKVNLSKSVTDTFKEENQISYIKSCISNEDPLVTSLNYIKGIDKTDNNLTCFDYDLYEGLKKEDYIILIPEYDDGYNKLIEPLSQIEILYENVSCLYIKDQIKKNKKILMLKTIVDESLFLPLGVASIEDLKTYEKETLSKYELVIQYLTDLAQISNFEFIKDSKITRLEVLDAIDRAKVKSKEIEK